MGNDSDRERKLRAEARRSRAVLHRTRLAEVEKDPHPIRGAEAISLLTVLSRESWALGGQPLPTYGRADVPIRFVRWERWREESITREGAGTSVASDPRMTTHRISDLPPELARLPEPARVRALAALNDLVAKGVPREEAVGKVRAMAEHDIVERDEVSKVAPRR